MVIPDHGHASRQIAFYSILDIFLEYFFASKKYIICDSYFEISCQSEIHISTKDLQITFLNL